MHNQNTSPQPSNLIQASLTKNKHFNLILLVLTAFFFAALLSILPSSQTSAATTSQQLPISINPQTIQLNSDGSASLFHCVFTAQAQPYSEFAYASTYDLNSFQNKLLNFEKNGNTYTPNPPYVSQCSESASGYHYTLADDGSIIGNFVIENTGQGADYKLARYDEDTFQWEKGYKMCSSSVHDSQATSVTQGFDGDIYAQIRNPCDDNGHRLVGVDQNTGQTKLSINLLNSMPQYNTGGFHAIHAYADGVVTLDGDMLRYFDYSGQEIIGKRHTISLTQNRALGEMEATPDGTVYFKITSASSDPCAPGESGHDEIYYRQLNGSEGYIPVDVCQNNTRLFIYKIAPDPSGGIAVLGRANNKNYMFRYSETGSLVNTSTLSVDSGYSLSSYSSTPTIDVNGNIIYMQQIRKSTGDKDRHVEVKHIKPDGTVVTLFSTKDNDIVGQRQLFYGVSFKPGVEENKVQFAICEGTCTHENTPHLYTIDVQGIGTDYPRNLIGTAIPDHDLDADGDDLTKWQEVQQQTADDNTDSDGDGLNDFLESRWNSDRHDLFCNGDQSVCEYPTPHEKDVYVEVDWMTRPAEGSTDSYTTKPNETQINEIKDAFEAKGIHAHFDTGQLGGGNETPYNEVVKFGIVPNEVDFFDYKKGGDGISAQFNQDRYKIYHYMLSGYRFNDPSDPARSGIALVSDDDFFVSFGALKEKFGFILPGQAEKAITGTIIHELGHNLCLTKNTHDVPECSFAGVDVNYGNDYPSAMNYDKQFELIDYSTGQNGANDHDDWGAIRLHDFVASNAGDEEHDLLQSMQTQSARSFTPLKMQPQYRELQNKLQALEKRIERHEDR